MATTRATRGILCPFQRDGKGDFANGTGKDVLASDLGELLGIVGPNIAVPGELPWRPELGTRLIDLRHRRAYIDVVRAQAQMAVAGAIQRWEPRIMSGASRVSVNAEKQAMNLHVTFYPRDGSDAIVLSQPL